MDVAQTPDALVKEPTEAKSDAAPLGPLNCTKCNIDDIRNTSLRNLLVEARGGTAPGHWVVPDIGTHGTCGLSSVTQAGSTDILRAEPRQTALGVDETHLQDARVDLLLHYLGASGNARNPRNAKATAQPDHVTADQDPHNDPALAGHFYIGSDVDPGELSDITKGDLAESSTQSVIPHHDTGVLPEPIQACNADAAECITQPRWDDLAVVADADYQAADLDIASIGDVAGVDVVDPLFTCKNSFELLGQDAREEHQQQVQGCMGGDSRAAKFAETAQGPTNPQAGSCVSVEQTITLEPNEHHSNCAVTKGTDHSRSSFAHVQAAPADHRDADDHATSGPSIFEFARDILAGRIPASDEALVTVSTGLQGFMFDHGSTHSREAIRLHQCIFEMIFN